MPRRAEPRRRDAAATRERLVQAAFAELHARGFHAASVDRVLVAAGMTKGALYHHFASKRALALTVVSEVFGGWIRELAESLQRAPDPIDALRAWVEAPPRLPLRLGCPLNNLAQEMAAQDEVFRKRIEQVFAAWRAGIATALRRGQRRGQVRRSFDAAAVAGFVVAALEGSVSLAKSARSEALFRSNMKLLSQYVEGLRGHSAKE